MAAEGDQKVVVHLRSTGDTPILKQAKFKGEINFRRSLNFFADNFIRIHCAFSPNPDELVIDLYNNFGINGKLVVNYALSMAWG